MYAIIAVLSESTLAHRCGVSCCDVAPRTRSKRVLLGFTTFVASPSRVCTVCINVRYGPADTHVIIRGYCAAGGDAGTRHGHMPREITVTGRANCQLTK